MISVPGRLFDVKVYHLAEILAMMDYKTDEMTNYINKNDVGSGILREPLDDTLEGKIPQITSIDNKR